MPQPPRRTEAVSEIVFDAERLGTRYQVYVDPPGGTQAPVPAIVVLDGDYLFDPTARAYQELRRAGSVPAAAIVGVGYGKSFGDPGNRRGRDYTPDAAAEEPESGGADAFLEVLINGIWPELQKRHALDLSRSIIAGHSLSGLLALHAVIRERPLFSRALVGAPSLWWADRAFLRRAAAVRERVEDLPARIFIGVGADDTESMLGDLRLFHEQLERRPFAKLQLEQWTAPGRDHYNAVPDLFREGLQRLLQP